MSDPLTDATNAANSAELPGDTPPPAVAEPAESSDPLDMEIPEGVNQFDRAYVEKLRDENRKARQARRDAEERLKNYEVFEQFDERDRQVWTEMAGTWLQDPTQSAQIMRQIAVNVLGDPNATPEQKAEAVQNAQDAEAAAVNSDKIIDQQPALTPEKVQELVQQQLAAERQRQEQDAAVSRVQQQIADAGYPKGTLEHFSVLWVANNDPAAEGSIDKAIDIFKSKSQAQFDSYVSDVAKGARDPITMPNNGGPGNPAPAPPQRGRELEDARRSADAWLAAQKRA